MNGKNANANSNANSKSKSNSKNEAPFEFDFDFDFEFSCYLITTACCNTCSPLLFSTWKKYKPEVRSCTSIVSVV
jgi:hypothetical protein